MARAHTGAESIETYIRAKDSNRPYLMAAAFAADATLEMVVQAGSISFPPDSRGIVDLSQVLVSRFNQTYENVHTFCLASPPTASQQMFSCRWLVGMSEKESGAVRVGCGRYDWSFRVPDLVLVEKLKITIECMQSLPSPTCSVVMAWLAQLPYPWCEARIAVRSIPQLHELRTVAEHLARVHEDA